MNHTIPNLAVYKKSKKIEEPRLGDFILLSELMYENRLKTILWDAFSAGFKSGSNNTEDCPERLFHSFFIVYRDKDNWSSAGTPEDTSHYNDLMDDIAHQGFLKWRSGFLEGQKSECVS